MKRILIVHLSDLSRAPRVLKQIGALKSEYVIDAIGTNESGIEGVGFYHFDDSQEYDRCYKVELVKKLLLHKYYEILNSQFGLSRVKSSDLIQKPDLIIAHDPDGFFLTLQLMENRNWSCPIVYDAHEYEPKHYDSIKYQWINRPNLCFLKKNIDKIDSFITVAPILARKYEKYLGLKNGSVNVTYNAPFYSSNIKPTKTERKIRLVVHGISSPSRKLEIMIETMKKLPQDLFSLDMYLVKTDQQYYSQLLQLADSVDNVRICDPVAYNEIVSTLNKYDVFFYSIFPGSFSLKYCLPNKFFEAVQARLAIVIGPSPEMRRILEKYDLGECSEGFSPEDLAKAVKLLTPEKVDRYKQNADKYAYELSAESSMKTIKTIVDNLVNSDKT